MLVHFVRAFGTSSFICGLLACCVSHILNTEVCSTLGAFQFRVCRFAGFQFIFGMCSISLGLGFAFFSRCVNSRCMSVNEPQEASGRNVWGKMPNISLLVTIPYFISHWYLSEPKRPETPALGELVHPISLGSRCFHYRA